MAIDDPIDSLKKQFEIEDVFSTPFVERIRETTRFRTASASIIWATCGLWMLVPQPLSNIPLWAKD
jgi:hypothetical protein